MSVLANISRVLILPKISCLAKKFSRLIIITSIFVIYANFDKNEGYHFHVALILPEFPRQCLLKFQFSFQGNISCTWITRFMVKFCFRYEIYGYEIYGRRCEIYGSLRDLWEGLRDLWEFARFMGVTRFMGRTKDLFVRDEVSSGSSSSMTAKLLTSHMQVPKQAHCWGLCWTKKSTKPRVPFFSVTQEFSLEAHRV